MALLHHPSPSRCRVDPRREYEFRSACHADAFPPMRKACIRVPRRVSHRRIIPDADLNCKIANESRVSRRVSARGAIGRGCQASGSSEIAARRLTRRYLTDHDRRARATAASARTARRKRHFAAGCFRARSGAMREQNDAEQAAPPVASRDEGCEVFAGATAR